MSLVISIMYFSDESVSTKSRIFEVNNGNRISSISCFYLFVVCYCEKRKERQRETGLKRRRKKANGEKVRVRKKRN